MKVFKSSNTCLFFLPQDQFRKDLWREMQQTQTSGTLPLSKALIPAGWSTNSWKTRLMDYKHNTDLWCLGFLCFILFLPPHPKQTHAAFADRKKRRQQHTVWLKAMDETDCSGPTGKTVGLAYWDYLTRKDLRTKLPIRQMHLESTYTINVKKTGIKDEKKRFSSSLVLNNQSCDLNQG